MKTDVVTIDNQGNGFTDALEEAEKSATYGGLGQKEALHLRLMAEEMLSLARSVTGEMQASFWIESNRNHYELHMTTNAIMDTKKREQLIAASTKRKNEAARSFLGKVREVFEKAMLADPILDDNGSYVPRDVISDVSAWVEEDSSWDGYERSVLRKVADEVKVGIRGSQVELTVGKNFA